MIEPPLVYLDTNAFIYFIEGDQEISDALTPMFRALRGHPALGVTSELTLAEVLAPTQRRGAIPRDLRRAYLSLLVWDRFIALEPISRPILYETVDLRSDSRLQLPDAIHLATAVRAGCAFFVTRDERLTLPLGMNKVSPDLHGVDTLLKALP